MQKKKGSGPKCRKHRVNEKASSEPSKTSGGRKRRTGKKWKKTEQLDEKLCLTKPRWKKILRKSTLLINQQG